MSDQVNDVLMGTSGPQVVKFPQGKQPVTAKGIVSSTAVRQATDMKTKEPKFFESGQPMNDVVIVLDNCTIVPTLPENEFKGTDTDDGRRRLIASFEMQKAIGQAIRDAGAKGIENGSELAVQYFADGPAKGAGLNPPKLFKAQYRAPVAGAGVNDLLGDAAVTNGNATPSTPPPAPQPEEAGSLL